jgi:hypothetical protein
MLLRYRTPTCSTTSAILNVKRLRAYRRLRRRMASKWGHAWVVLPRASTQLSQDATMNAYARNAIFEAVATCEKNFPVTRLTLSSERSICIQGVRADACRSTTRAWVEAHRIATHIAIRRAMCDANARGLFYEHTSSRSVRPETAFKISRAPSTP